MWLPFVRSQGKLYNSELERLGETENKVPQDVVYMMSTERGAGVRGIVLDTLGLFIPGAGPVSLLILIREQTDRLQGFPGQLSGKTIWSASGNLGTGNLQPG